MTRDGRLAGVVSERDLFPFQRVGAARTAERIAVADTLEELVESARAMPLSFSMYSRTVRISLLMRVVREVVREKKSGPEAHFS